MRMRRRSDTAAAGVSRPAWLVLAAGIVVAASPVTRAAEPSDAQALLRSGKYAECIAMCDAALGEGERNENWWTNKLQAQLALGQYAAALTTYGNAVTRQPRSIQIRLVGRDVLRANDRPQDADAQAEVIVEIASDMPWRYGSPADRATLGRAMLITGQDARRVLEGVYDPAKKADATAPEPVLASGDLALEKSDFALAAEAYEAAAKLDPKNPAAFVGLARSYESDPKRAAAALDTALKLNPSDADALLLRADGLIDREGYAEAETLLAVVLATNPHDSRAWAYRAVLEHLANDSAREQSSRTEALSSWKTSPQVDHLIGLKLSQKYRFAEGRAYQEKSLAMNADYLPAKLQLAQDLLRLGDEAPGWRLADTVTKADPYDVLAYNLATLRDHLAGYRTIGDEHTAVRMDPREADLYGVRATALLARARETLLKKYDVDLPEKTTVEIFPRQQDFAIRTFGLPGGGGYLGVCFGNVITVNSPASRMARPANWEAVLWHEFCHTVTLRKTRNKMPRWLSEGISVYEETQENPAWGQRMNPMFRGMILAGDVTPVSQLSGAFLKATTPQAVQFAYFESFMVVRYVVDHFGPDTINRVLADLGAGVPINNALAKYTVPIEQLDKDFDAWLRTQADRLAKGADLSRDAVPTEGDSATLAAWSRQHANNVWGLLAHGQSLLAERKWQAALAPLQRAAELYPDYAEADGPYVLMAAAYRELGDATAERAMLEKHVGLSADAVAPRLRLLELTTAAADWPAVRRVATDTLAINPLIAAPHQYLARAAEALADRSAAIAARRALLTLDTVDTSAQHYRLAKLLAEDDQFDAAKRQVLMSLEETPRYADAHRLLLDVVARRAPTTQANPRKEAE